MFYSSAEMRSVCGGPGVSNGPQPTLGRQFCVIVFVIFFYHFLFYKSRSLYASVYNACQSHFVQYFKLSVLMTFI